MQGFKKGSRTVRTWLCENYPDFLIVLFTLSDFREINQLLALV